VPDTCRRTLPRGWALCAICGYAASKRLLRLINEKHHCRRCEMAAEETAARVARMTGGRQRHCNEGKSCAICGSTERICWDHCHRTGVFRGWLCGHCNSGLGFFRDNPVHLQSAIRYLAAFRGRMAEAGVKPVARNYVGFSLYRDEAPPPPSAVRDALGTPGHRTHHKELAHA
jgi:hypothetical protein